MREAWNVTWTEWFRFDQYEVRDGYIRPAPGANLERYDPWQEYFQGWEREKRPVQPYLSLDELLKRLDFDRSRYPLPLTPESEVEVATWCAKHGLLGLLPHTVQGVVLAPRWEPSLLTQESSPSEEEWLYPTVESYYRTTTRWRTRINNLPPRENLPDSSQSGYQKGDLVSDSYLSDYGVRPGVFLRDLSRSEWRFEPLDRTWAKFFPDVALEERATYRYPRPLSEPFWRSYAEPLADFYDAAKALGGALSLLEESKSTEESGETRFLKIDGGLEILYSLLEPVRPALARAEDGSFLQYWESTSLLGSFAMMAYADLTQRRVRRCEACGSLFNSEAHQTRFCSDKCRHRVQKRKQREERAKVDDLTGKQEGRKGEKYGKAKARPK